MAEGDAVARPEIRGPGPDESTRTGWPDRIETTSVCNSSTKGLDSTVAESVAVEVRKISVLPDRRIGRPGPRAGRLRSWELEDSMQAFGVLLLAAATAGDGFGYS